VFVPIHDRNPLKSIQYQYVTVTLIILNVAIYVLLQVLPMSLANEGTAAFALIPAEFIQRNPLMDSEIIIPAGTFPVPERFTLVSYMFLHGNFIHLAGNMLFLWVFGDNVEDAMGHVRFLMFYTMCGIFAGVVHIWAMPHSTTPLIGASGAVSGIITAYLMLHPKVKTWVLAFWWIPLRISAAWALGFWAGLQVFNAIASSGNNVAWWAHVGGLVSGALLILFMRRPGVRLFDKTQGGS